MLRTSLLTLLALTFGLGCSSDDFTATADSGAEASTDAISDTAIDVPSDTASTDAGTDAQGTFCDGQAGAIFCEDFDKGSFTSGWTPDPNNNQPLPTLAGTPTKSGTGSLKMSSAAADGGPSGNYARYLRVVKPAQLGKATLDAELFVSSTQIPGTDVIVPLAFGLKDGGLPVAFILTSTGWSCGGPSGTKDQATPVATNTWHHVKLEAVAKGGDAFDVACTLDSVTLVLSNATATGHTGDRRLVLGHNTSPGVGATEIYLDNFVFRSQ